MRWFPLISAGFFGIAALLFSFAPLLFNSFALPSESAFLALFAAPPALLWGYIAGRHLRRQAHIADWIYFAMVGAAATIASALTGALILIPFFLYDAFGTDPLPLHQHIEAAIGVLGYGFLFGIIASPFGIATGLALQALSRRLQQPTA